MKPNLTVTPQAVEIQLGVEGDWEQAFAALLESYCHASVELIRENWGQYSYDRDRKIVAVQISLRREPSAEQAVAAHEFEEALKVMDEIEQDGGDAPHRAVNLATRIRVCFAAEHAKIEEPK